MGSFFQILILVTIGCFLLWFGYNLFTGQFGSRRQGGNRPARQPADAGTPGDPQVCPICSSKLYKGDLVQTHAYPSITGGKDRLMYIKGCLYCINGDLQRTCPVCGSPLSIRDILVSRMFDRSATRSHVHILGCSKCRRMGKL